MPCFQIEELHAVLKQLRCGKAGGADGLDLPQDEVDLQRTSLTPLEEGDVADHVAASSVQPGSTTAWAQLQQNSRRILSSDICWAWPEAFDKAYLGEVEEGEQIAAGFGGIVRLGHLKNHQVDPVATKELHRDPGDEVLFKEVYLGFLIPTTPCLGFAETAVGAPRLVSRWLSFTAREYFEQNLSFDDRKAFAVSLLEAVVPLTHLGLAQCDVKADNFMVDNRGTAFIIDFGAVSFEGDEPPMTCTLYRPPDEKVSLAWDIYRWVRCSAKRGGKQQPRPRLAGVAMISLAVTQDHCAIKIPTVS
eukprot:s3541_g4.t1